jgi:TonB family protein
VPGQSASRPLDVGLAPLTSADWDANRAIAGKPVVPPAPVPPPPPPTRVEPESPTKGQIVDVAPSKDQRPPKDSRFLAEHDSTVEKETRSRWAGTQRWENVLPAPSAAAKGEKPEPERGDKGEAAKSAPGRDGAQGAGGTGADRLAVPKQPGQERLAMAEPGQGEVAAREDRDRVGGEGQALAIPGAPGEAQPSQRKAGELDARLRPDPQALQRIAGGPAPMYLPDVEEGDATVLNTRQFKFATYFNRIGRAIDQHWDPNRAYLARDPDGSVYGRKDRITQVRIRLDSDGGLKELTLVRGCGLDFLDQEALKAVREAAPFPNPPPAMVHDEQVDIGMFTFVYELSRSGGMLRLNRPRGE